MVNKNTYVVCKKGGANQKQQLSDYGPVHGYIAILVTKRFDISSGGELASYNLLFRGCHESKYFIINESSMTVYF